jgi:hypothetical protein
VCCGLSLATCVQDGSAPDGHDATTQPRSEWPWLAQPHRPWHEHVQERPTTAACAVTADSTDQWRLVACTNFKATQSCWPTRLRFDQFNYSKASHTSFLTEQSPQLKSNWRGRYNDANRSSSLTLSVHEQDAIDKVPVRSNYGWEILRQSTWQPTRLQLPYARVLTLIQLMVQEYKASV